MVTSQEVINGLRRQVRDLEVELAKYKKLCGVKPDEDESEEGIFKVKRDLRVHHWVVVDSEDYPQFEAIANTKKEAIDKWLDYCFHGHEEGWAHYEKEGYRYKRVTLVDGWKEVAA